MMNKNNFGYGAIGRLSSYNPNKNAGNVVAHIKPILASGMYLLFAIRAKSILPKIAQPPNSGVFVVCNLFAAGKSL